MGRGDCLRCSINRSQVKLLPPFRIISGRHAKKQEFPFMVWIVVSTSSTISYSIVVLSFSLGSILQWGVRLSELDIDSCALF